MNLSDDAYLLAGNRQKIIPDIGTILSPIRTLAAAWVKRRTRTRELRELARFTDRDLWDVGLSRSDIWSIEQGTYRRD